MSIRKSFQSSIQIILTSADLWGSIRLLNEHAIAVYDIQQSDALTVSMRVAAKSYLQVKALLEKRGDNVVLQSRSGFLFTLGKMRARPVLCGGVFLIFLLFLLLPTRILLVDVEGNQTIPTQQILEAAEECGIRLGASRRTVRSEKMKNALLSSIPELQWAGVNTHGCRAVISVQERSPIEGTNRDEHTISSIIAGRDGIITSVSVVSGTVLCRDGQAVKSGQTLISGYLDHGFYIRAIRAEGEIYAETIRDQECITPDCRTVRGEPLSQKKNFSLILGKKRINLWKGSGIWDSSCGRISREYRVTLPGGFSLPIAIRCDTLTSYQEQPEKISKADAASSLSLFSKRCLEQQMIAGSIDSFEETVNASQGCYVLTGEYRCTEMIGREHIETGAPYEQNN